MNNFRVFYPQKQSDDLVGNLYRRQPAFVTKVIKLKENDKFNVINEAGEWIVQIKKITKAEIVFQAVKRFKFKKNSVDIGLAFSPIQSHSLNFMIQ